MSDGIQSLQQRHPTASSSVTEMPHGTEVRSVGAMRVLLDTSMTFPRSPPLETRSGQSVCGDDRLLTVFAS